MLDAFQRFRIQLQGNIYICMLVFECTESVGLRLSKKGARRVRAVCGPKRRRDGEKCETAAYIRLAYRETTDGGFPAGGSEIYC